MKFLSLLVALVTVAGVAFVTVEAPSQTDVVSAIHHSR